MQKFLFPEFGILDLGIQNSTDKESRIQYLVGVKPARIWGLSRVNGTSSLETQGQSVRLGEKARQKFSITKYQVPSKTWDWLVFSHGTG